MVEMPPWMQAPAVMLISPPAGSRTLLSHLVALGAHRALAQRDPDALGWWSSDRLGCYELTGTYGELVDHLTTTWRPPVVVSPWNSDTGFWPADRWRGLDWLRSTTDARFAAYREAIDAAQGVVDAIGTERPRREDKPAIVAELGASLPDEALDWLSVAVPSRDPRRFGVGLFAGPAGGNNGRWDWSRNYIHCLQIVFGQLGLERARELALAALTGEPDEAIRMSFGHLTYDQAPGNPWLLLLATEGVLMFAADTARVLAEGHTGRVAPWTFEVTRGETAAVAEEEDIAGELWAPLWYSPRRIRELEHMHRTGQVVVRSGVGERARWRSARTGLDVARSASTLGGMPPGVDALDRWIVAQRAGQAYRAIPA